MTTSLEGILPIDKPKGRSSFSLIPILRKKLQVQKIGHIGTLDPIASGVLVFLIGKNYTKIQGSLMKVDKEYNVRAKLGSATATYDTEGKITHISSKEPTLQEITTVLQSFQGNILQIPPMFCAKKHQGNRLYALARRGITIPREPVPVTVQVSTQSYSYPHLELHICCSSGTYVRSIVHDLGTLLGCYAHIEELCRTRCGEFRIQECISLSDIQRSDINTVISSKLIQHANISHSINLIKKNIFIS